MTNLSEIARDLANQELSATRIANLKAQGLLLKREPRYQANAEPIKTPHVKFMMTFQWRPVAVILLDYRKP